jgi:hypothetical protein
VTQNQGCQFRERCPVYLEFPGDQKQLYITMYCTDHVELCARRRLRLQGEPVPPNMAPNGLRFVDLSAFR